jgi:serine/threonine protein phosphatase PrpC
MFVGAGEVSVSRSIGDYPYKGFVPGEVVTDFFSWPENHDMIFNADLVISDPESKHVDIDELCEFVIIASDGLWDVVSNEKAVSRVR